MADSKENYEAADTTETTKATPPTYAEDGPVNNDDLGALPGDRPPG